MAELALTVARESFRAAVEGVEWLELKAQEAAFEATRVSVNLALDSAALTVQTAYDVWDAADTAVKNIRDSDAYRTWEDKLSPVAAAKGALDFAQKSSDQAFAASAAAIYYSRNLTFLEAARKANAAAHEAGENAIDTLGKAVDDVAGLVLKIGSLAMPVRVTKLDLEFEVKNLPQSPGWTVFNMGLNFKITLGTASISGSGHDCLAFYSAFTAGAAAGAGAASAAGAAGAAAAGPGRRPSLYWRPAGASFRGYGVPSNSSGPAGAGRRLQDWNVESFDRKQVFDPLERVLAYLKYAVQAEIKNTYSQIAKFLNLPDPESACGPGRWGLPRAARVQRAAGRAVACCFPVSCLAARLVG